MTKNGTFNRRRAVAFVDGSNFLGSIRESTGDPRPVLQVRGLAEALCDDNQWQLDECRFYIGLPHHSNHWYAPLRAACRAMQQQGVVVVTRKLDKRREDRDGRRVRRNVETGIDLRIALDLRSKVLARVCDVAILFTEDQDFSPVADLFAHNPANASETPDAPELYCAFPGWGLERKHYGVRGARPLPIEVGLFERATGRIVQPLLDAA